MTVPLPAPAGPAAGPPPAPAALSPEMLAQLRAAKTRAAKLRRARAVARFDGWCTAIFAALTLAGSVFDPCGLLIAVPLAAIAAVEFYGEKLLRRLDLRAPKVLGWNQVAFAALLILYAAWNLSPGAGGGTVAASVRAAGGDDPQLASVLGSVDELERLIRVALYGSLIAVAILVQGGTALYYFTRAPWLRAFLEDTPAWIQQLQQAGGVEL